MSKATLKLARAINKAAIMHTIALTVVAGATAKTVAKIPKKDMLDLAKAIRAMILNPDKHMAYYSRVVARMARKVDRSVSTMAVSVNATGWTLHYNPEGIAVLTFDQLCYVIKHEILHVILQHHKRAGDKFEMMDNEAMDLAVNSILGDDGGLGGIHPGQGSYADLPKGKSYEWYYLELHKKRKGKPKGGCYGTDGTAEGPQGPLSHNAHKMKGADKMSQAQAKAVISQAWKESKAQGTVPGELEGLLEDMMKPRYNWKALLRKWCGDYYVTGQRSSRKRLNRRLPIFGQVPGYVNEYCAKVVVVLDTSGSMDQRALNMAVAEIKAMGIPVIFVQCDAAMQGKAIVTTPYRKFKPTLKGGGGTDFRPPFEFAKKVNANGIIYITDMYGTFPDKNPAGMRTLWVSVSKDMKAPFGDVIYLPLPDAE